MSDKEILNLKPVKNPDSYYINDEIIAFFNLEEVFPSDSNEWPIYSDRQHLDAYKELRKLFNDAQKSQRQDDTFEMYFHEILNSEKILLFSKTENKFVDQIIRKGWVDSFASLTGESGDEYYLPNGKLFFRCVLAVF